MFFILSSDVDASPPNAFIKFHSTSGEDFISSLFARERRKKKRNNRNRVWLLCFRLFHLNVSHFATNVRVSKWTSVCHFCSSCVACCLVYFLLFSFFLFQIKNRRQNFHIFFLSFCGAAVALCSHRCTLFGVNLD